MFRPFDGSSIFRFESLSTGHTDDLLDDLFKHGRLYLNSRDQFNDPFDMQPCITGAIPRAHVEQILNNRLKEAGEPRRMRKRTIAQRRTEIDKFDANNPFDLHLLNDLNKYGIKCFAQDPTDVRMWSYYADSHRGFCVEFKRSDKSGMRPLMHVDYADERPTVVRRALTIAGKEQFPEQYGRTLLTKAKAWSTEREVRLLVSDRAREHVTLLPGEINAIYLGCRVSDANADRLIALCKANGFPVSRMLMCERSFSLIPTRV